MFHINKVNTWYGKKYAVTSIYEQRDANGSIIHRNVFVAEYHGSGGKRDVKVALFDLTDEGLQKARDLQKELNK